MQNFWYTILQKLGWKKTITDQGDKRKRKLDRYSDDEEEEEIQASPKLRRMDDFVSDDDDVKIINEFSESDHSDENDDCNWTRLLKSSSKENNAEMACSKTPGAPKSRPPLRSSQSKHVNINEQKLTRYGSDDEIQILSTSSSSKQDKQIAEASLFREPFDRSLPVYKGNQVVSQQKGRDKSSNGRAQGHLRSCSVPSVEKMGMSVKKDLRGHRTSDHRLRPRVHQGLGQKQALGECYRLEEKRSYQSLLQRFTTLPVQPPHVSSYSSWKSSANSLDNAGSGSNESLRSNHSKVSRARLFVDLTNEPSSDLEIIHVKDDKRKTPVTQSGRQGLRERSKDNVSSFDVSQMGSLRSKLGSPELFNQNYSRDLNKDFEIRSQNRAKLIEEQNVIAESMRKLNEKDTLRSCEERMRRHLAITEVELPDEEEEAIEEVPVLPTITDEMEAKIKAALKPEPGSQVLVTAHKLEIRRRDMHTLASLNWLNDEVINFYMCMIAERSKQTNFPSTYVCSTFLYPKIMRDGHASVRRWTKSVDIFSYDLMLVPVHLGMHWCLAVADLRRKVVKYYDSMGGENNPGLKAILKYLECESLDKKKVPLDTSGWSLINVKNIPQQMNGSDCGMFTCKYAEYISRDADISFTQQDMPFFRRLMVYEILNNKIL